MREIVYKYLDHLYYIQGKYILYKEDDTYIEEFWVEMNEHIPIFDLSLREYKMILKDWIKSHNPEFNLISIHPILSNDYAIFREYLSLECGYVGTHNISKFDTSKFKINEKRIWNSICYNYKKKINLRLSNEHIYSELLNKILKICEESIIDY